MQRSSFWLANCLNSCSTAMMIPALSLCGRPDLAIDVAILEAAALVACVVFFGDARRLLTGCNPSVWLNLLLRRRLTLGIPLAAAGWILCTAMSFASPSLVGLFVVRRLSASISELSLIDAEFFGIVSRIRGFLVCQIVSVSAVVITVACGLNHGFELAVWICALAPGLMSLRFVVRLLKNSKSDNFPRLRFGDLLSDIRTTGVFAVSAYAASAMLIGLAGKPAAGDLAAASLTGGLIPFLVTHAGRAKRTFRRTSRVVSNCLDFARATVGWSLGLASFGALILVLSKVGNTPFVFIGKSVFFQETLGFSLIGGGVLLWTQRLREHILRDQPDEIPCLDMLTCLAFLTFIPFIHQVLGVEGFKYVFFLDSIFGLSVYSWPWCRQQLHSMFPSLRRHLPTVIAAGLLVPVFVQLTSGLFRDRRPFFEAGGKLTATPLPLSLLFCYLGLMLVGGLGKARVGISFLFCTGVSLHLATLGSSGGDHSSIHEKTLLGLQFLLPMPAFALGQAVSRSGLRTTRFAEIGFVVLLFLIPLQLAAMISEGRWYLVPNAFFFSIYQQVQYVPVVLAGIYFIALFGLFPSDRWRKGLVLFSPLAAAYFAASISLVTIGFFFAGTILFGVYFCGSREDRPSALTIVGLSIAVSMGLLVTSARVDRHVGDKYGFARDGSMPLSISQRIPCWEYYSRRVFLEPESWLVGHAKAPPRDRFPSAHNIVLDFAYNFGVTPLMPILVLTGVLATRAFRHRRRLFVEPAAFGLALSVLVVVVADNQLKVGLRQPYSGIVSYFLCGLLMSQLDWFSSDWIAERIPRTHDEFPQGESWAAIAKTVPRIEMVPADAPSDMAMSIRD